MKGIRVSPLILACALSATLPAWGKGNGNFAQRHPHLTTAAGAVGAYKLAKHGAKNRRAVGRKPNFAERHPVISGVAGAAVAHHFTKKKK